MPTETININAVISDLTEVITQASHGFVVGNVLRCDNATPNLYVKAQADTEDNAKAVGVVSQVININSFVITYSGRLLSGVPADAQGTVEYLSDTVAGAMTSTAPSIVVRIMEISQNAVSGIVNIDWEGSGSGGAFIPLAGTGVGSPVTGDIEMNNSGGLTGTLIKPLSDGIGIGVVGGSGTTDVDFRHDSTTVRSTDAGYPGVEYDQDYSANFTNRSLVDKEYVDNAAAPITLQTDGTPNGDQTLLNIAAGAGITLTDNGTGTVTIDNSAPATPAIVYITRVALQALLTGATAKTTVIYRITDAVGSTLVLDVFAISASAISGVALDHTNTGFIFYNIIGDTIIQLYAPPNSIGTLPVATAAGTVNAITATFSPAITLADKTIVAIVASGANTISNPTFNPNGLGAGTITKKGGQILVAGDIPAALSICFLEYNLANTRWELANPFSSKGTIGAAFNSTTVANGATNYFPFYSGNAANTPTESLRQIPASSDMVVSGYRLVTGTSQPATGSFVITLRINGVDTALTVTIAAGAVAGTYSDLTNVVYITAGDLLTWKMVNNASTSSAAMIGWSLIGNVL